MAVAEEEAVEDDVDEMPGVGGPINCAEVNTGADIADAVIGPATATDAISFSAGRIE